MGSVVDQAGSRPGARTVTPVGTSQRSAARAPSGRALGVDGARVSAVVRDGIGLVVRVFNASPEPSVATIERDGPVQGWIVDLLGRPVARFEGTIDLRPWEIATLRLD